MLLAVGKPAEVLPAIATAVELVSFVFAVGGMSNKDCDGGCWARRALLLAPRRSDNTKLAQIPKACIDSIDYERLKYGGGGGS